MLNLNYNINNTLRNQRNFLKGKVDYRWRRIITTAAGLQSGSIIFGTGSIDFVPFDVETLFLSGTYAVGELSSGSAVGQPVDIKVTGSGVWPTTGSNSMYITIGSSLGFNQSASLQMSAQAGNMNLSGSVISSSFFPVLNNEYNIDFGLNHTKGNIYNPIVNLIVQNVSSASNIIPANGYTASFAMVKDENVGLYSFSNITGSTTQSFEYQYNFGVTSSLTASINNVTGSTTMSFVSERAGLNEVFQYFNPDTILVEISSSFVATTDEPYDFTASVEFNKGNESNSAINWRGIPTSTTQDLEGNGSNLNGASSSFQLKKDIAVMESYSELTASISGSYPNNYSFNQTASLTQNVNNTTGSVTMSIVVPESNINVTQSWFNPTTTQALLTASFVPYGQNPFNVTASVINNKGNEANSDITYIVSASNVFVPFTSSATFNIDKDTSYNKQRIVNVTNAETGSTTGSFQNQWAFNMTASLTASFTPYYSGSDSSSYTFQVTSLRIPEADRNVWSYETSSLITASFAAQTDIDAYNITASVLKYTQQDIDYVLIGGGGGSSAGNVIPEGRFFRAYPGAGAGAGSVLTGSIKMLQNYTYQVNVGNGGAAGTRFLGFPASNGETSSLVGQIVPYAPLDPYNFQVLPYMIAPGGGAGGNYYNFSQDGGSGAGKVAAASSIGSPTSASLIQEGTMTASLLNPFLTGQTGSNFPLCGNGNFGGSGDGGTKPTSVSWLTINGGLVGGGGKRGGMAQGSFTECDPGAGNAWGGGGAQGWIPNFTPEGPTVSFLRPPINGTGGGAGGGSLGRFNDNNFSSGSQGGSGSFSLRYLGTPKATGGAVTSSGEYTVHTFLRSQDFIWNNQLPTSMSIEYLLVAGGGGSGFNASGGAGGGQIRSGSLIAVNRTPITVVVGAGGAANTSLVAPSNGSESAIYNNSYLTASTFTCLGGGNAPGQANGGASSDGAYGGGGNYGVLAGGIGVLGFNGGSGSFIAQNNDCPPGRPCNPPYMVQYLGGGGGAGAGQNGANAYSQSSSPTYDYWTEGLTTGSEGGNGLLTNFSGSAYFGGGGGGCRALNGYENVAAPGGLGGGGNGPTGTDNTNGSTSNAGYANTGGGAGGSYWNRAGANGGSGIALIKYAGAPIATGGIVQYDGVNTIHRFESSGLFEFIQ